MTRLSAIGLLLLLGLPACSAESRQETEDSFEGAADTTRDNTRELGQDMREGYDNRQDIE